MHGSFICLFLSLSHFIVCSFELSHSTSTTESTDMLRTFHILHRKQLNRLLPSQEGETDSSVIWNEPEDIIEGTSIESRTFSGSSENLIQRSNTAELLKYLRYHNVIRPRSTEISINRQRRGIVLVDEDFNVPPEPGVKQGWSDGDFTSSPEPGAKQSWSPKNLTKSHFETETTNNETTIEGSGLSDKPTSTSSSSKSVFFFSSFIPSKLQMSTSSITNAASTDDMEGSGDFSTSVLTSQITETDPISDITDTSDHINVPTCFNITCDLNELVVSTGASTLLPEGTNLTLSCILGNGTEEHTVLKWYRQNSSDNALLQQSMDVVHELNFDIPQTKQHHSGTYLCLKQRKESCCYRELTVSVYQVPSYKQHLIIVGLVVAVGLCLCILLVILRRAETKKYEVQLELQSMEKPMIILNQ